MYERHDDVSNIKNNRVKRLIKSTKHNVEKKLETGKLRPIFEVDIVHHNRYPPTTASGASTTTSKQVKMNDIEKRITMPTEKHLLAKGATGAVKQLTVSSKNVISKNSSKDSTNVKEAIIPDVKKQKFYTPVNHIFKLPCGFSKMSLFGLVSIEKTPSERDFFARSKSTDFEIHATNTQEDISS